MNKTKKEMCELVAQYLKATENITLSWRVIANFDSNSQYGSLFDLYDKAEKYFR